ncbi:DNA polymerase III epsilon subunit family exonuclease [Paucimonas lemoignei]|uniref:DNA-directed DNA polymerase n=1 Tax=Paucimonas lemoignei TaxID=29443 RepID=A0A4R3I247_PAULE|nr:exonuclease domain-containing protein [Paucimonas lemoignei]TCS39642.1 DNA polymerase III epsilon subunit family exonuclease [Paucimonas lemoignei]
MPARKFTGYRFALLLSLLCALQLAVIAAVWLIAGSRTQPPQRWGMLAALAVATITILSVGLKYLLAAYWTSLSRLTEELALLPANPAHRIAPLGAQSLQDLIDKINGFACAYQALEADSQARIACANHALTEERNRLAALIADLASGVLVCNLDGRILLYNRRARQLLERHVAEPSLPAAPVGLGRSLYGMIERASVMQALEQVRHQLEAVNQPHTDEDPPQASASFVIILAGGRALRVRLSPVLDESRALDGFVLVLDEIGEEETGRFEARTTIDRSSVMRAKTTERPIFYDFDLFKQTGLEQSLATQSLAQLSYTAFDSETTGLNPAEGDEIVAIGAVRIVNGRLLLQEYFDCLIRPRCAISEASVAIHGITETMLKDQPRSEVVLPQFARFAEDTVLVAHNAAFDLRFLQMQEEQTGIRLRQPVLDTLLLSQVLHPNQTEHSLEAIAGRMGVEIVGRHTALGDAIVTGEVFLRMLPLLAEKGIRTLGQAHEAERQTRYARLRY